ncbi:hypothetical protein M405DRAFT_869391 [Rhizopogon salebrosus TDB-379]|nr:hypothetical protein M405DRAFT_869391 [Rhizopogon salebrosus TDB-379]
MSAGGALGAPQNSSTPLINIDDAVHTETLLDAGAGTYESTPMSIAPLLGSVNGLGPSMLFSTENDGPEIYIHHSPSTGHLSEAVSWSDLPDNGEIGDVPEFPILRPTINSPSAPSTPRIPAALKGKGVDPEINKKPIDEMDPKDWLDQWSRHDEWAAGTMRPGMDDPDISLGRIWDDNNRRRSLQFQNIYLRQYRQHAKQNMNEHDRQVSELHERIRELETLVTKTLIREEEARKHVREAYSSRTVSGQAPVNPSSGLPPTKSGTHSKSVPQRETQTLNKPVLNIHPLQAPPTAGVLHVPNSLNVRYQRASSVLPPSSSVKRAMLGPDTQNPGPTPLADSSDDSEYSSTEYDHGNSTGPRTAPGSRRREKTIRPGGHESDALSDTGLAPNDFGADFLTMEPESDHASDSDSTKRDKRAARTAPN